MPAEPGSLVAPIEGHPNMVGDEILRRSVKKTLTIPYWLNEAAERHHINFSRFCRKPSENGWEAMRTWGSIPSLPEWEDWSSFP